MLYDSSGQFTGFLGSPGNNSGQFYRPVSMTVDEAAGEIIVLDRQLVSGTAKQGARVQFFTMTGAYLRGFTRNSDQGVKATYYKLDGGATRTYTNPVYVPGGSGAFDHTLEFWSEDWSGNEETPHHTVDFTITAGTATLRLVWGDSDTGSPPSHPDDWADWYVRRGGFNGPLVASGSAANTPDEGWTGINDVVVPVLATPYHVSIDWWDSYWGWDDNTTLWPVYATTPGEIIILRY